MELKSGRSKLVRWGKVILKVIVVGLIIVKVVGMIFDPSVSHAASPPWTVTTHYGDIDSDHATPHKGVDFAIPQGTPIHSLSDGTVVAVRDEGNLSFGRSVMIQDHDKLLIYGHLSQQEVHVGDHVHFGEEIAKSGNTGDSTGPHLHFQVNINGKPVDPSPTIWKASMRELVNKMGER
jgi:murein DD-endopeptidase MepM/ murein hydrolase activator NlpD